MVVMNKEAEDYVRQVIRSFQDDPKNPLFDHIILPPPSAAHLPRLFLWSPLEHFGFSMKCPIHKHLLTGTQWTDNLTQSNRFNPRLIYDVGANILLIQRIYLCNGKPYKHDLKSVTTFMFKRYPIAFSPTQFPFKLYRRSIVSYDLIDQVFKDVLNNISFARTVESFSALKYANYQRIYGEVDDLFYSNILYSFQSADKILNIFLDCYNDLRPLYETYFVLPEQSISIDCSYKIGKAYQGKKDHKDFLKYLVFVTETGQIITWNATTDDAILKNISETLKDLKDKLEYSGDEIKYIYTCFCCDIHDEMKMIYRSAVVKYDINQFIKSVQNCLPEGNGVHEQVFMKEVSLLFCQKNDKDEERALLTASSDDILANLDDLIMRRENYITKLSTEKQNKLMKLFETLKFHIIKGCCSDIPVQDGADSTAKFYQEFDNKRLVTKAFMYSPEVAMPIFSVHCISFNRKVVNKKHASNCKVVPYLPRACVTYFLYSPKFPDTEKYKDFSLLLSQSVLEEDNINKLACRIYHNFHTLKVVENVLTDSKYHFENFVYFISSDVIEIDLAGDETNSRITLRDNLSLLSLVLDERKDNSNLFQCVVYQVLRVSEEKEKFVNHLEEIGIKVECENEEDERDNIVCLRSLVINEIKHESWYQSFLTDKCQRSLEILQKSSVGSNGIEDLILEACANILGVPVVLISSSHQGDIQIHLPIKNQILYTPIFVAHDVKGEMFYGTYSTTEKLKIVVNACRCRTNCTSSRCPCKASKTSCTPKCHCKECENNKEIEDRKGKGCRCGEKRGEFQLKRCTNAENQRASRCPCLKSLSKCSSLCVCKGCANPYGVAPDRSLLPAIPRAPHHSKREETIHKKRPMKDLFEPVEEEEPDKELSYLEKAAVISCIRMLILVPLSVVAETIHAIYSAINHNEVVLKMGMKLRKKSVQDVQDFLHELKLPPQQKVTENVVHDVAAVTRNKSRNLSASVMNGLLNLANVPMDGKIAEESSQRLEGDIEVHTENSAVRDERTILEESESPDVIYISLDDKGNLIASKAKKSTESVNALSNEDASETATTSTTQVDVQELLDLVTNKSDCGEEIQLNRNEASTMAIGVPTVSLSTSFEVNVQKRRLTDDDAHLVDNKFSKISEDYVFQSEIPEITKNEECCLGVDEAGRGPVLGPMVYGICYCPISMKGRLGELGFADSKTLSEAARDKLLTVIEENNDFIGWAIKIISPTQISNDMLSRIKISLNELSHGAAIELTKKTIADGAHIKEMFVDTVGDATKYQGKLSNIFDGVEVTVTPKADAKFPVVSAASICAKVARDRCIKGWKFPEGDFGIEYGSGYPNDPATKSWLREIMDEVFGYPQLVRFSWSTCSNILDKHAKEVTWDDDEEIDEVAKGTAPITSFFAQKTAPDTINRCRFFGERKLQQVYDL